MLPFYLNTRILKRRIYKLKLFKCNKQQNNDHCTTPQWEKDYCKEGDTEFSLQFKEYQNIGMFHFLNLRILIAYRGESKNRLRFFCLFDFQSHHPLRSLILHINYILWGRRSNNFHGLTIKTKRILGLQLVQMQVKIIVTSA